MSVKMKVCTAVFFAAVAFSVTISSTYATRGMIVNCPRSLEMNAINKLYMSLFDVDAPGIVKISLVTTNGEKTIAETEVKVEKGENEKVIELKVPETTEYQMRIWANGTFETEDSYSFYEQDEVYSHTTNSIITFIQTDKPLYKPKQEVKLRVLPVDRNLRPLGKDVQAQIRVEDPSGSRIAQWKNVSVGDGIKQFEFPLSQEPNLGRWKIAVELAGLEETLFFEVKEYVLPTFEVTITTPPFVLADAETIPVKICARYTYGKNVQGALTINSSLESYSWSLEKFPVYEIEDKIDGCYNYELNVSLVDKDYNYVYRKIEILAQVTEDGTGVVRNGTAGIQRTNNALNLQFLEDDYKTYFKPGLPYQKRVKVTNPDDTAAPNEEVEVCATISRQRILQKWWATRKVKFCKNYTSDAKGIVQFHVPPQKTDTISLFLEAKCSKYGDTPRAPGRPTIYQPRTSTSVQPYYSPSKSYIEVQNAYEELACGSSQKIKVLFSTQEDSGHLLLHYQVISKGQVLKKGSKEVSYDSVNNTMTSTCKDSLSVNDVRTSLVPSGVDESDDASDEDIDCSSRPIGTTEIDVQVAATCSPSFRILVYYVRPDDEVVADSSKFEVEKCFQNKVDFQFGDEEKQPGTRTSITLKASPNSVCGTKVLDKSISLLDSNDPITKDKIFQILKRFDSQQYYHRNHCNDRYRKGGKNKMAQSMFLPPRPWSSSQYADAVTAFEDTGFVVLSDLTLQTRPCTNPSYETGSGYGGQALASVGVRGGAPVRRPMATTLMQRRRPFRPTAPAVAMELDTVAMDVNQVAKSGVSPATKSAVDVRSFFPETWLFDVISVGESGEFITKATLPHTITEWVGNAVCLNEKDGLGLSNTARVKGFQAFFLSFTLPYSVIRGEKVPLIISTFNYLDKCLPITRTISITVIADNGTVLSEDYNSDNVCVCGGKADTFKYMFTPDNIGTLNLTVLAESAQESTICGDKETADVVARDMATKSLEVEAEGFPQENVNSFLFCPEDYDESTYNGKLNFNIPENAVEGSARGFISISGDIMGPAIDGLDRLVRLPTGCGEQNMVLFTPNIVALDYLTSVGKLTEAMKTKATTNLQTGYQRELKYRHPDGSYSAFGISDKEGSMWLSAFVVKSFSQAKRYIDIDEKDISQTVNWILQKQRDDGCFPRVGTMFSEAMKGGVGSQDKDTSAALTAYVLSALLVSGNKNETVINGALTCIGKDTKLTPYTAALYGYATASTNNEEADRYLTWLSEKAITEGDEVYWRNVNSSKSIDVETAAYAIMTILNRKGDSGLSQALSIVRHLTRMRNSNGGFISTQDTVVGLKAIALFASIISQDPVELTIKFNGGMLDETLDITEDDKLLMHKRRVPVVPSAVDVVATGRGCGLIQATTRYNTLEVAKQKFFSLRISAERSKENCKKATVDTCVSYLPENQKSNMAVVEIKMVSGFVAVTDSLNKLLEDLRDIIKKHEIENNNVILYFEELSNENICFKFDVEEMSPVEDSKPATAKLYDYYAKEKEESADYSIAGNC